MGDPKYGAVLSRLSLEDSEKGRHRLTYELHHAQYANELFQAYEWPLRDSWEELSRRRVDLESARYDLSHVITHRVDIEGVGCHEPRKGHSKGRKPSPVPKKSESVERSPYGETSRIPEPAHEAPETKTMKSYTASV